MRNWYDSERGCGCNDNNGNAIIGTIINGTKYKENAVQKDQYEKDMTGIKKTISEIQIDIQSVKNSLSSLSECVKTNSDSINTTNQAIRSLSNSVSDLTDKQVNISKELSSVKTGLKLVESSVVSIDERVKKLENIGPDIKITSFKASPVVALAGSEVDVKLTWGLNTQAESLTINGNAVAGTSYTAVKVNASRTFTLIAADKNGNTDSASAKIDFMNQIIYGASTDSAPTSDTLSALETKLLSEETARTINVNCGSGAYIYYAFPKRLGKVKFYSYGMFEGGFDNPLVIAYKNSAGYMEEYNVYRSSQKLTQTIEISTTKEE